MSADESEDLDAEEEWEEHAYFTGDCTCDHAEEARLGRLWVDDCPCEAGWEE